jgi:hypothetical protein
LNPSSLRDLEALITNAASPENQRVRRKHYTSLHFSLDASNAALKFSEHRHMSGEIIYPQKFNTRWSAQGLLKSRTEEFEGHNRVHEIHENV